MVRHHGPRVGYAQQALSETRVTAVTGSLVVGGRRREQRYHGETQQ